MLEYEVDIFTNDAQRGGAKFSMIRRSDGKLVASLGKENQSGDLRSFKGWEFDELVDAVSFADRVNEYIMAHDIHVKRGAESIDELGIDPYELDSIYREITL